MIRAALFALLLLPLGCTVTSLPGSESNRLGSGDGGTSADLAPAAHDDGGGCGGGSVDLAEVDWSDGGVWSDGGTVDGWFVDLGYGTDGGSPHDGGPHDGGPHVDLAH